MIAVESAAARTLGFVHSPGGPVGTAAVVPMPPVNSSNPNAFFQFNGIKANSPSDVWAVGDSGVIDVPNSQNTLIEHFNGRRGA